MTKKRKRPVGETIGGILVGFDQQIFRDLPPAQELVQQSRPLRGLVDGTADRDLVRFLVLAHHGRLRLRVRDDESEESMVIHGLDHGGTWHEKK